MKKALDNKMILAAVLSSVAVAHVGCAPKNQETVPTVQSTFKMTGSSSAATVAHLNQPKSIFDLFISKAMALIPSSVVDATGATVSLSSAWAVVKEVEFKSEEAAGVEDSEIEVEFKGPYYVDLLSNTPIALDTQAIAEKPIRRIKMKLEASGAAAPAGAPSALASNSIYFVGSVGGRNFTVKLDDGSEVQIGGPNAFTPGQNSELMVEIQVANVFKQIDLSTVTNNEVIDHNNRHAGTHLCDQIDASANDLYTCFRKGFEKHADFGQDRDGDDDLETGDDSVK